MLVRTLVDFDRLTKNCNLEEPIAIDTETSELDPNTPHSALLGVSIGILHQEGYVSFYVPITVWDTQDKKLKECIDSELKKSLVQFLKNIKIGIGHNFNFDKKWIKAKLGCDVSFKYDTQIMWHLSSAPYSHQSYGLKNAMKQVLGWDNKNDVELKANILKNSNNDKSAGFYMADLDVLGKYAALDAQATLELFYSLKPFFDEHSYWDFVGVIQSYKSLLLYNTQHGIRVDRTKLLAEMYNLMAEIEQIKLDIRNTCALEIKEMEQEWAEKWILGVKTEKGREKRRQEAKNKESLKFNASSSKHLEALLFNKLGLVPLEFTETGKAKTDKTSLKQLEHPAAKLMLKHSHTAKKIAFCESYLKHSEKTGRIHPSFNITGTVSGRLSCYEPNIQQAPFQEPSIMQNLTICGNGIGIQADLVSIEPFFTAYFSEDPLLLKIYKEGKGDIYLDLALTLFPNETELKELYNPLENPSSELKDKFKKIRSIAKTVHLSSQYGAGARKIAETLTKSGISTSYAEGKRLHALYWDKFKKVKEFEQALYSIYREDGKLINPFGRVVRIPDFWCKDLLNRFIQSTAHDALMHWVLEIDRLRKERDCSMIPIVADVHDATAWEIQDARDYDRAEGILRDGLANINKWLNLPFPIRAEYRKFYSLAEWK